MMRLEPRAFQMLRIENELYLQLASPGPTARVIPAQANALGTVSPFLQG